MEKWKIDVAVLCIFFARPEQFEKSFEQVRKARPRVLLLWQDGPREGRADDVENIRKCREIAENIDWECEVHRNYHDKNMGCDPSTFYSHKWAFSIVDKCIILEDDLVASQSFFTFCKELLDKYENDERVDRICGTNLLGHYDIPFDYFGIMGVPKTFLDKYNPEQFEILGYEREDENIQVGIQHMPEAFLLKYREQGGKGHYTKGMKMLCFYDKDGNAKIPFSRILIRRKQ